MVQELRVSGPAVLQQQSDLQFLISRFESSATVLHLQRASGTKAASIAGLKSEGLLEEPSAASSVEPSRLPSCSKPANISMKFPARGAAPGHLEFPSLHHGFLRCFRIRAGPLSSFRKDREEAVGPRDPCPLRWTVRFASLCAQHDEPSAAQRTAFAMKHRKRRKRDSHTLVWCASRPRSHHVRAGL